MHFYIIMRRETNRYVRGATETDWVSKADRYYSRKLAMRQMGPNTCVCGPYLDADFNNNSINGG